MDLIIIAILFLLGIKVNKFMPSYFIEKAKNIATKEDIEEITKKIENIKLNNEIELSKIKGHIEIKIELEKLKSKNTEFYFQKQFDAMKEFYKLKTLIIPNHYQAEMDKTKFHQNIINNFISIEEEITNYSIRYFSVLPEYIINKIDSAKNNVNRGIDKDPKDLETEKLVRLLIKEINEANSELKAYIELQIHK